MARIDFVVFGKNDFFTLTSIYRFTSTPYETRVKPSNVPYVQKRYVHSVNTTNLEIPLEVCFSLGFFCHETLKSLQFCNKCSEIHTYGEGGSERKETISNDIHFYSEILFLWQQLILYFKFKGIVDTFDLLNFRVLGWMA